MRMRGGGEGEHPLRVVHPDHRGGACLRQGRGELGHAAAEVERAPSLEGWKEPHEVSVLGGLRPARSESLEARVAGEELRVVVDVLRRAHGRPPSSRARQSRHERRGGPNLRCPGPACISRASGGTGGQRIVTAARLPCAPVPRVAWTRPPAGGYSPCWPSAARTGRRTSAGAGCSWKYPPTESHRTTPSRSSTMVAGRGTSCPSGPPRWCTRPKRRATARSRSARNR